MKPKILIRNGRLLDPAQGLDQPMDILVADGVVAATGAEALTTPPHHTLDASGCIVAPGFIDLHAALREPGYEHKGTIATETAAAARSGFTHVVCPPYTQPVADTAAVVNHIKETAADRAHAYVLPLGGLTQGLAGKQLSEMHSLKDAGCIALSNGYSPIRNTRTLVRCLEYAATLDMPVFFNAEDPDLAEDGCAHAGSVANRMGLTGIPDTAEAISVAKILLLVEQTGVRAHFNQLSCARSVELIAQAKEQGLPVTADVALHQLLLTDDTLEGFNSLYHLRPPLRTENDRDILRQAVAAGIIDAICSAHQPHEPHAKAAPFQETEPGMATLDSFLPLALELVRANLLTESQLIERLTLGPNKALGRPLGGLQQGAAAHLTVVDPDHRWQLTLNEMLSKGFNSPFVERPLTGATRYTLLNGQFTHGH